MRLPAPLLSRPPLFRRPPSAGEDSPMDALARLDEVRRRLAAVDLLIIDDFALRALYATQTNDFYELRVHFNCNL